MIFNGWKKSISRLAFAALGLIASQSAFAQAGTPASMNDYWTGNAQWDFVRKWTPANSGIDDAGSSVIKVANGTWYLFSRKFLGTACSGANSTQTKLGIQVYKSTNQGATWTGPVSAVNPVSGTQWGCQVTDGDAYYDAAQNKWRLLYQCLGESDSKWRGCYAERLGSDPMGTFTPVAQNPVIQPKSLWSQICNDSANDDCAILPGAVNAVSDEGTFKIIKFDGQFYWVSFHGYDGTRGYRGIAKTTDFVTWIAGNPNQGLPSDAIIDAKDGNSWREGWQGGSIGGGDASIIEENGYYYQTVEIADKNLACTAGQNWDVGLFRSASLSSTTWEQFPFGNPIVYSSKAVENGNVLPCNVQYAQIFKDTSVTPNVIYLKYARSSVDPAYRGTYLYRLNKSTNLLKNGDLWTADGTNWNRLPASPTNLAVYRLPNLSPNGTQFLATNCGTYPNPCNSGTSIYQDVDVTAYRGRTYRYGGKFATGGGTGAITLMVHQLDQNFAIIQNSNIVINATANNYQAVTSTSFTIASNAKYLRYQFYLNSSAVTYFADDMFINLN